MTWRAGGGQTGDHLIIAAPFAPFVRRAWRKHTYGEIAAATGLSVTTIHDVMHGERPRMRARTAVKLQLGLKDLERRDAEQTTP